MTVLRIYYVYLPFLILLCSNVARSADGESNVYTLLFGSGSTIADLHKQIKIVRERLREHHQSLNNLQQNYANLQKRFINLEQKQKLQINDNLLSNLQKFIQTKLSAQSQELVQKQTNYKKTLQNILERQNKSIKDELKKFETKVQNELHKEGGAEKQLCGQTPIEFLKNLRNNKEAIKKLPPEANTILSDILNIIQNSVPVASNEVNWPSYETFLPYGDGKVVEINAKPAAGVEIANSCDDALKSAQNADEAVDSIYALNMAKYDLANMYGYCLNDPNGDSAWLVIQRRIDGELSFKRNWQEYKMGFGNLAGSFFIGLERLHKILRNSHAQLWIQLGTEYMESPYRIYNSFSIANEEDKYRLTSVFINDDIDDDLVDSIDCSFQTYDVKSNDNNCAKTMQGGWWYDEKSKELNCRPGNLNGNLEGVIWNEVEKVVYTHMAIRFTDPNIKVVIRQKD